MTLIDAARDWVTEHYPPNRAHLIRALEWLDALEPGAAEAVRLATLTHDMERAFPGADQPVTVRLLDHDYLTAHSARSARIVGAWLRTQGAAEVLVTDVERLILAHEFGGEPEADLVQAADSLSFLDTNIDLFLGFVRSGRFSIVEVRDKFNDVYERIRLIRARRLAAPLFAAASATLTALEAELPPADRR
jgi:hypothetical protein